MKGKRVYLVEYHPDVYEMPVLLAVTGTMTTAKKIRREHLAECPLRSVGDYEFRPTRVVE